MGVGIGTDFKIYNDQINGFAYEKVTQFIDAFGGPSRNAIQMETNEMRGDYEYESFFKEGDGVERRDPDSVADLTDVPITQDEDISVKLHRRFTRATTRNQWLRIGANPTKFGQLYGGILGPHKIKEMLNTGISACAAALSQLTGPGGLVHDATDGTLAHSDLITGLGKRGDAADAVVCWVMHSKVWFNLMENALTANVFNVGNTIIYEGTTGTMGKPVIVTDSAGLILDQTTDKYVTLGLVEGAIRLVESEGTYTAMQEVTGKQNILNRFQTEYAYNLSIQGFKYRTAANANPNDAAIASAGNWTKNVTSNKSCAGVYIVSQ